MSKVPQIPQKDKHLLKKYINMNTHVHLSLHMHNTQTSACASQHP